MKQCFTEFPITFLFKTRIQYQKFTKEYCTKKEERERERERERVRERDMGGLPGDVCEDPMTYEKRKKGWRMSYVDEATERLENEL